MQKDVLTNRKQLKMKYLILYPNIIWSWYPEGNTMELMGTST